MAFETVAARPRLNDEDHFVFVKQSINLHAAPGIRLTKLILSCVIAFKRVMVMVQGLNSRPVLGVAVKLEDLERIAGLREFVLKRQRDLEIQDFIAVDALRQDWRPIAERSHKILDGHTGRIGIHGPFLGFALDTPDPDVRAIVKARLNAGLDACAAISRARGGAHMVVHSPFLTRHWYNRDTRPAGVDEVTEHVHLSLGDAVKRAETEGITIVIENIEDKDPLDRVVLARSFASPAVAVSLDTGHAHYAHGVTRAPPVDVFVRTAGDALAHVHVQDADGFADRHWAIGEGTICWPAVFRALGELPEMPRLMLELADARGLMPSAAWLNELGLAI